MDVDYPRLLLAALTLSVAVGVGLAAATSTASFGVYNPTWDGSADLRTMTDKADASLDIVTNTTEYTRTPPTNTLAIVLSPTEPYSPRETDRIQQFVRNGGTLLVAEDFGPYANPLLAGVGASARIVGTPLRDERYNYRRAPFPIARNVPNHTLTRNVDALTLNYGTVIRPNNATVLVRSSEYAYLDVNRNEQLDDTETIASYPVATVEPLGDGRVIVVSDPSVFINAMLERPGNHAFAQDLVESHRRVLLDYSHASRLPPLAALLLAVRASAGLSLAVGLIGATAIAAVTRHRSIRKRLRAHTTRDRHETVPDADRDPDALAEFITTRHPEWDEERVRRVMQGIMNSDEEPRDND